MVRFKKRYLVVEVVPEKREGFQWGGLKAAVVGAVKRLHGDFGVGATAPGFSVKYHNTKTLMAFICVGRGPHRLVSSAIPFISEVGQQPATVRILHTAASMRHGFIFLKKFHEEKLKEMEGSLTTEEKRKWEEKLAILRLHH